MGNTLDEITELTYLQINNPWRWKGNIENTLNLVSDEKVLKMLVESGIAYLREVNITDKDLMWYFEGVKKTFNANESGALMNWMFYARKENHLQNLEDVKKIYSLVRSEAIERGIDVKKYPEKLEELTE
jgi:hypothetical protein